MTTTAAVPARADTLAVLARAGAWIATVLAPIHALARFETTAGAEDLASPVVRAWAEPAADLLRPLLSWSGPDTVYVTYGKLWLVVVAAAAAYATVIRRDRRPTDTERWGWRLALPGYALLTLGLAVTYWTPLLEPGFAYLVAPGMLLSLIGSTVLGVALLRRSYRPVATAWLLALWLPLFVALSAVIALGAAVLPMLWAWALTARSGRSLGATPPVSSADGPPSPRR